MKQHEINLTPGPGVSELIIRSGEAAPIILPVKNELSGNLSAPGEYYLGRTKIVPDYFDKSKALVLVNADRFSITFIQDPNDSKADSINGEARLNLKDLSGFRLVESSDGLKPGPTWTTSDLGKFLRRNRHLLKDQADAAVLIRDLMNFKAKISGDVEQANDNRGNTVSKIVKSIDTNLPVSFWTLFPIFKGGAKVALEIELYLEANGTSVTCSLECPSLEWVIEEEFDDMLGRELSTFIDDDITVVTIR